MTATDHAVTLVHTAARAASDKLAQHIMAFDVSADAYTRFMGRFSGPLSDELLRVVPPERPAGGRRPTAPGRRGPAPGPGRAPSPRRTARARFARLAAHPLWTEIPGLTCTDGTSSTYPPRL